MRQVGYLQGICWDARSVKHTNLKCLSVCIFRADGIWHTGWRARNDRTGLFSWTRETRAQKKKRKLRYYIQTHLDLFVRHLAQSKVTAILFTHYIGRIRLQYNTYTKVRVTKLREVYIFLRWLTPTKPKHFFFCFLHSYYSTWQWKCLFLHYFTVAYMTSKCKCKEKLINQSYTQSDNYVMRLR